VRNMSESVHLTNELRIFNNMVTLQAPAHNPILICSLIFHLPDTTNFMKNPISIRDFNSLSIRQCEIVLFPLILRLLILTANILHHSEKN
jgi:hypothetical protein